MVGKVVTKNSIRFGMFLWRSEAKMLFGQVLDRLFQIVGKDSDRYLKGSGRPVEIDLTDTDIKGMTGKTPDISP
jgi:hypothetical protein